MNDKVVPFRPKPAVPEPPLWDYTNPGIPWERVTHITWYTRPDRSDAQQCYRGECLDGLLGAQVARTKTMYTLMGRGVHVLLHAGDTVLGGVTGYGERN